jgi:hypothetical protein
VALAADGGGATIHAPYHLQIFHKKTGARLADCPGAGVATSRGTAGLTL